MLPNDFNFFSDNFRDETGLKQELNMDLGKKVVNFRNRFLRLFLFRYTELLPHLIKYRSKSGNDEVTRFIESVNWLKVEFGLRNGFQVVIGKNQVDLLSILGYSNNDNTFQNMQSYFRVNRLYKKNITFTLPNTLIPKNPIKEIIFENGGLTGDFVVLKNKPLTFGSDYEIIRHYAESLSEIVASRYSLIIQSKAQTILRGDVGDETINQITRDLYNGVPYLKTSPLFDPNEDIITINNATLSGNLVELKREYQNQQNELNSMLGVDVLGVDKSSGVSDIEAKSGNPFSKNISNVYIDGRQTALDRLNQRYDLDIECYYDNNVASELNNDNFLDGGGGGVKDDDNSNGNFGE